MKKRNVHNLVLNKKQVSNLQVDEIKGGDGPTDMTCNTVPRWLGGLGCHLH